MNTNEEQHIERQDYKFNTQKYQELNVKGFMFEL